MKDLSGNGTRYYLETIGFDSISQPPIKVTFVSKDQNDMFKFGTTSEEVLKMLIDRHEKLSKVSNQYENEKLVSLLKKALNLQETIIKSNQNGNS